MSLSFLNCLRVLYSAVEVPERHANYTIILVALGPTLAAAGFAVPMVWDI
jgi:hypothetical protein